MQGEDCEGAGGGRGGGLGGVAVPVKGRGVTFMVT